jgi:hypothetical protein
MAVKNNLTVIVVEHDVGLFEFVGELLANWREHSEVQADLFKSGCQGRRHLVREDTIGRNIGWRIDCLFGAVGVLHGISSMLADGVRGYVGANGAAQDHLSSCHIWINTLIHRQSSLREQDITNLLRLGCIRLGRAWFGGRRVSCIDC